MRFVVYGVASLVAAISHIFISYSKNVSFQREAILVVASATFGCLYYATLYYEIASASDGLGRFEKSKSGILLGLMFLIFWAGGTVIGEFLKIIL